MHYSKYVVMTLVGATFWSYFALSNTFASDSFTADISLSIPISCTLTSTIDTPHAASVEAGTYQADIGTTTLKTVCNDSEGFSIYAIGYSNNEFGNNKMIATVGGVLSPTYDIITGTSQSGDTSNWAMKLTAVSGTHTPTILNSFGSYHTVPDTYTQVATRTSGTDFTNGASIQSTYAVYVKGLQPTGSYNGRVRYVLVHPNDDAPAQPQTTASGYLGYYSGGGSVEGTMGLQSISSTATSAVLVPSNFSRKGYGFAGWSDAYDYKTNPSAHFYGPQETIYFSEGQYTNSDSGLSLYAVWIPSAGSMQTKADKVCNSLPATTYNDGGDSDESTWSIAAGLSNVSALTDARDNQTYAIAKLPDGNCWMIENLRIADTHQENNTTVTTTLTADNTNNPLLPIINTYDNNSSSNHLSPTSNVAYNASTAPEGWCTSNSAACNDQSRLRTDNTANRVSYATTDTMSANANLYSYGNYYNFYSATAGNGTYDKVVTDLNGDLCPSGWHLPTGIGIGTGPNTGELGLLSNSLGGYQIDGIAQEMTSSTAPTHTIMKRRFRHFPINQLYAGWVDEGASIEGRGSSAFYWSSTPGRYYNDHSISYVAGYEFLYSTTVIPGVINTPKYYGGSVRCLFDAPRPVVTEGNKISYNPNARGVLGTMGLQSITSSDTSATLLASNYSREGYGFAGWSDAYDYETNPNAHFYGPQEEITFTAGQYDSEGLSLYAMWIPSAGSMQSDAASVCSGLTTAALGFKSLNSVSALTDQRDGQTYAIAKLADGNCWMIENLRLADKDSNNNDVILSSTNTNNPSLPLTNIYDTSSTSNHLSPTSSIAYVAGTAPEGWCNTHSADCDDQSRIRTDNTANRATYTSGQTVSSQDANLYSYGNYYNWYSATAGNGTYSKSSDEVAGDLCPSGWRLPYGRISGNGKTPGGFYYLNYKLNNDSSITNSTAINKLRAYPNNFLYSGGVSSASLNNRGSNGTYWSSTVYNNNNAFYLIFHSSGVSPGSSGGPKYAGRAVRCIAPSS